MKSSPSSFICLPSNGGHPSSFKLLGFFITLFIILGLSYAFLTPVFENSDETLHYPYVKHLADGQGLPLAVPGQLWRQEGTQPPLYYAIIAAATVWLDTDNLPELLQSNPHWLFTEVRTLINDNQNLVLHGPMDAWPFQRAALAIHIGRWWSLFFGLLTVMATFWLGRYLFPHNLPLTLTATALTALNPQFLRVSATVSNDSLSAALTTWAVLAAFYFTEPGEWANRRMAKNHSPFVIRHSRSAPLLLGLLTGLALLTKLSSLTTLLVVAFIIFWRLFWLSELHEKPLQTTLAWLALIGGITLLLTGWWFWRNYQLYGEWFATETHLNLAGRGHLSLAQAWSLRVEAERAYWATFGWGQIRPPEWVYQLCFWFSRIGLAGLVITLSAKLIRGNKSRPLPLNLADIQFAPVVTLLLWAGFNLALYLRWITEVGSVSHTRLVFPALAAISLLLALGWHSLLPRRLGGWISGVTVTGLLALNLYSLGWLIGPAFRPDGQLSVNSKQLSEKSEGQTAVSGQPSAVNLTFLNSLKLTGGGVDASGEVVRVTAQWQTLAEMNKNYSVAAVLLAPDGRVLARRETYPGLGLRPTRYLRPGETFTDVYPLRLPTDLPEPLVAQATVNLFDFESAERAGFPAIDATGQEVTPFVGQIKLIPRQWPHYQPQQPAQVNFNQAIALVGFDQSADDLTLYWQSLAPVDEDYNVFVHLLDASGQVIAQADGPPTGNTYPTRWWSPGEIIADRRTLPPASGAVALRLGLYSLTTGQRLPINESSLPQQDNVVQIPLR